MTESTDRLGFVTWVVLASLAAIPPAFAGGFTQFEFLKETLLYVLTGLGLLAWGVTVLRARKVAMTGGRLATVIIVFALFALLAVAWAPSSQLGFVSAANWLAAATLFLLVTAPGGKPLRFSVFATAVAVGTAAAAAVGLLDAAGVGLTTTVWDPPGAAGSFDAREFAVGYYAVALPVLAAAVFRAPEKWRKGLAGVALALGGVHLGFCADPLMVGVVAGAAGLAAGLMLVFQGFNRVSFTFGPIGALAGALAVAAALAFGGPAPGPANDATELPWVAELHPRPLANQVELRDARFAVPRMEEVPNWQARSYLVGIALDFFREQPIIGHGPASWWALQTKFPRPDEPFVKHRFERYPAFRAPHNGFALIVAELGGVGLFLFLAWLSGIIGITVTALARRAEPENWLIEHFGLAAGATAGFACALFTPSLQLAAPLALLAVVAAMLTRESAALNDFKGMSTVWHINQEGRRWDTTFFCGVVPVVLGLFLAGLGGVWGLTSYYRSWGDLAMLRTKYELAVDKYSLANDLFGGDGEMLFNEALALKRLGRLEQARDLVNEAAELREYDVRVITLISELHLADRAYADAVKASRRAVSLFPNYVEGRRALATSLDLQGRAADAAAELLAILELEPDDYLKGTIHRELGEYYEGALDNPAKAVEHYKLALGLMERNFLYDHVKVALEELEKEIERRRLQREGKPIPPELMPAKVPDDGHGHGPHDGHDH